MFQLTTKLSCCCNSCFRLLVICIFYAIIRTQEVDIVCYLNLYQWLYIDIIILFTNIFWFVLSENISLFVDIVLSCVRPTTLNTYLKLSSSRKKAQIYTKWLVALVYQIIFYTLPITYLLPIWCCDITIISPKRHIEVCLMSAWILRFLYTIPTTLYMSRNSCITYIKYRL